MVNYQSKTPEAEPFLKPMQIQVAVDAYLDIKKRQELKSRTLKQNRSILLLLAKAFNQSYCNQIKPSMIEE